MGLLDDAIREHLELKRRRGADAGDISRQESEALGPVRRFPDGAPDLPDTFEPPRADAEVPLTEAEPWEGEETAVHRAPPDLDFEPPPLRATTPLPPEVGGYEPPAPPSPSAYEPPSLAPAPEPAIEPDPEPEPASSEPAWRAYAPDPEPAPPTYVREPDPEFRHAPDPEPEPDEDPWSLGSDPEPAPDTSAEPPSRFARLRIGRRGGKPDPEPPPAEPPAAAPAAHDDYEPPPLPRTSAPSSFEPSSPYEPPPPAPPSSYGYDSPTAPHEPDIVPADDEGEAEDVLEETPDFLEETPEHDRLWFEQRPPRDFNFDD